MATTGGVGTFAAALGAGGVEHGLQSDPSSRVVPEVPTSPLVLSEEI